MSKLWIFGDSFSQQWDYNCMYSLWKGYAPKVYGEIISDKLGIECINYARGGLSNYDIFESICKNVDRISPNDIIIIGWTSLIRFRLVNNRNNKWLAFQPNNWDIIQEAGFVVDGLTENTFNEIIFNRGYSDLYKEEVLNWIKLLSHTFKNNKLINWNWSRSDWELSNTIYETYQTIIQETNGEIIDFHYSESGQYELAIKLLDMLSNENYSKTLMY
jgi:hypothetical protein